MFSDIKRLGKYSLELVRFYAAELVEILFYMHSKGVVHRGQPITSQHACVHACSQRASNF